MSKASPDLPAKVAQPGAAKVKPPANTHALAAVVQRQVRSINRDLTLQGTVAIAWGLLSGFSIFVMTWASCFMLYSQLPLGPTSMALIITGIFLLVATISTLRGIEPEVRASTQQEQVLGRRLGYLVMGRPLNILGASSGITMVIMHCPASLIGGWGYLRHRLPGDETTINAAAAVLARAMNNATIDVGEVKPATAAIVLIRTGLVKTNINGETIVLAATIKAREVLNTAPK